MANEKKAMLVVQLNIDVIAEILSRLCVKDLIRFKCVCKAWLQLISSKDFIKLHLQRSSFKAIPMKKHSLNIDCHRIRNGYPCQSTFSGSSCDGLVCLFDTEKAVIHIWNPALRSSACIPMKKQPPRIKCFWFGLHKDEYKLVLGTRELEMHVVRPYTNSSYKWRSTQKLSDGYCHYYEIGTLFNGNVHWPVRKRQLVPSNLNNKNGAYNWTILSYDLHHEKVGEIVTPEVMCSSAKRVRLGEVDGCLSALVYRTKESEESELWAMTEYGVKESWTKLIVIHAESAISFNVIRLKEAPDDHEKIKFTSYMELVYVESLVSPKRCAGRLLRSHKKSCRIIEECEDK